MSSWVTKWIMRTLTETVDTLGGKSVGMSATFFCLFRAYNLIKESHIITTYTMKKICRKTLFFLAAGEKEHLKESPSFVHEVF